MVHNHDFPAWYHDLHQRLTTMADTLNTRVTPWQAHDAVVTPEEMGYTGGKATAFQSRYQCMISHVISA